jgi:hypothetical protein
MGTSSHSIEVNAPLQIVYYQWTQFEEFPRFMEGVEEVRYQGPNRLFWKARIGGKDKQWEAEITEQVLNKRIAWQSVDGTPNRGVVMFEPLDVTKTRITLTIEYEPEGFLEQAGDALGLPSSQIGADLDRFREFIEKKAGGTDPKITEVLTKEQTRSIEPVTIGAGAASDQPSHEQKPSVQDRELPPAAVITEAIASGLQKTPSNLNPIQEEPAQPKHGTVIADGPQAMAIEGSSGEENVGMDRGTLSRSRPTQEQIARRAYKLWLERGAEPGHEREDWLRAEKELSERSDGKGSV